MNALFIIDTAPGSGKGHLIRTLEIIKQFKKNGWQIAIIIERCVLGKFASEIMDIADTLDFSASNSKISIKGVIKKASVLNCDKIIIDSYKVKYKDIPKVNSTNLDIYRIIDAPTNKVEGVQDIKLGIRFNLQATSEGLKVIYPIRQLPARKYVSGEITSILFYFGSEPSNQQIKLSDKIAKYLKPSIKSYFYIANKNNVDSTNMSFMNDIDKILSEVSLIICSASTIIYEAAFMAIPCITISTNKSQENRDIELELLGHCMNLQQEDLSHYEKFKNLIQSAIINLKVLETEVVKGKKNLFKSSDLYIYNCITEKFIDSKLLYNPERVVTQIDPRCKVMNNSSISAYNMFMPCGEFCAPQVLYKSELWKNREQWMIKNTTLDILIKEVLLPWAEKIEKNPLSSSILCKTKCRKGI